MRIVPALLLCFMLAACGIKGLGGSFVGTLPEDDATVAIANDAAAFLAEEYAPGHTKVFVLTPEKDAQNAFHMAFDNAMREKGFTMLADKSGDALTVAYTLDCLKDDDGKKNAAWYLQIRLSDAQAFARSYTPSGLAEAGRSTTSLKIGKLSKFAETARDKSQALKGQVEGMLYE